MSGHRPAGEGLVALGLASLPGLLFHRVLDLWWLADDFFNLRYVHAYGPLQYGFEPAVWHRLPFRMLTPLLFASLDLDLDLFGLRPRWFYFHQLAAAGLATAALYLVLRLWLPRTWAAAGAGIFWLGPAAGSLVGLLMVRHYIEAIPLAVGAVGALVLAVRQGSRGWSLASALLYLAACLEKEIAVPLPFLLALLPEGGLGERFRRLRPHAAVLGLYLALRLWMLGTFLGGYGWAVEPGGWPRLAVLLPGKLLAELAGHAPSGWVLVAILGGAGAAYALAVRRRAAATGALALLAVLPVLPVSTEMEPRYALALWLLAVVLFAFAGRALAARGGRGRAAAGTLLVVVLLAGLFTHVTVWGERLASLERMSTENRAFLRLAPGDLLRKPLGYPASMAELARFKTEMLGLPAGAGWFYDDLYLSTRSEGLRRVWEYDPSARRVVDVTASVPALRRRHRSATRGEASLTARLHHEGETLFWRLGPYGAGSYAFVLANGVRVFEVPQRGGFQLPGWTGISFRVRYRSPEGWVTYSPELSMDFERHPSLRWRRGGAG